MTTVKRFGWLVLWTLVNSFARTWQQQYDLSPVLGFFVSMLDDFATFAAVTMILRIAGVNVTVGGKEP